MWSRWRNGWVIMTSGPTPDFIREFPWGHRREADKDGLHQAEDDGRSYMLLRGLGTSTPRLRRQLDVRLSPCSIQS